MIQWDADIAAADRALREFDLTWSTKAALLVLSIVDQFPEALSAPTMMVSAASMMAKHLSKPDRDAYAFMLRREAQDFARAECARSSALTPSGGKVARQH